MKKGAQILDRFKKKLDFVFFPLGLSNFWVGAWFPFDKGQFTLCVSYKNERYSCLFTYLAWIVTSKFDRLVGYSQQIPFQDVWQQNRLNFTFLSQLWQPSGNLDSITLKMYRNMMQTASFFMSMLPIFLFKGMSAL